MTLNVDDFLTNCLTEKQIAFLRGNPNGLICIMATDSLGQAMRKTFFGRDFQ